VARALEVYDRHLAQVRPGGESVPRTFGGLLLDLGWLDEARAFLEAHPLPEAQQAVAQTLERLTQDVALRERLVPEVSVWLRGR